LVSIRDEFVPTRAEESAMVVVKLLAIAGLTFWVAYLMLLVL
jgi:hypothetical protein